MKLSQAVALLAGKKEKLEETIRSVVHSMVDTNMFGMKRTYSPINDDGEHLPPESKKVSFTVDEAIDRIHDVFLDLFEMSGTVDNGNTEAYADVVVNGEVFAKNVPPTQLMAIERNLESLKRVVEGFPVLDPTVDWKKNDSENVYQTDPINTIRTQKDFVPIVLYDATPEHPAQTNLVEKDVPVGVWSTVKMSGSIPRKEKEDILDRIEDVINAVRLARENANSRDVETINYGEAALAYIFGF